MKSHNSSASNYSVKFKEELAVNVNEARTATSPVNAIKEGINIAALKGKISVVHVLTTAAVILSLVTASFGLFSQSGGMPNYFTNQYGDVVKLYGKGLYRNDSFFKAPIFRGTDCTIFFVVCPLLIMALISDIRRKTAKSRLLLVSVLTCIMYYAASIAFGVTYNWLQLVYILLFAACFFGLVTGIMSIDVKAIERRPTFLSPHKGINRFLIITGIALFAAWLPDIITALVAKRPLVAIENYTTEITYVIDMGIVAPTCFICYYLLKHRKGLGYVLLDMLLTLCIIIGIMLPVQTIFQLYEGINIPVAAVISKLVSFCVLALFAVYFKIKTTHNIAEGA